MSTCRLIFISTTLVLCNAIAKEDPIVETKYGNVRGREEYSKSYRGYYAFKGIPYARPPIGSLRFKPPLEPLRWSNILTTQEDAPHCLQKNYLFSNPRIIGSEDCLYLNVYTPREVFFYKCEIILVVLNSELKLGIRKYLILFCANFKF
ncbi:hypothetical protein NQ318_011082 [Aromia moschata]|uniref:Carboxylesterase type B domain-containing protein n=1 Tax=Aromia moschata TaxID=1265417 RepID=A0AAV8YUS6_9CUCU|nr:hypothetical protein NQ318_011082 [Aromia moschata]